MSYSLKDPPSLGLAWEDVAQAAAKYLPQAKDYIQKAGTGAQAGKAILDDPYFPEVTCHLLRLRAITKGQNPGPRCPSTVTTPQMLRKGIGLQYAAKPLRAVVYTREKPWVVPVAALALVGVPFLVGLKLGKGRR